MKTILQDIEVEPILSYNITPLLEYIYKGHAKPHNTYIVCEASGDIYDWFYKNYKQYITHQQPQSGYPIAFILPSQELDYIKSQKFNSGYLYVVELPETYNVEDFKKGWETGKIKDDEISDLSNNNIVYEIS